MSKQQVGILGGLAAAVVLVFGCLGMIVCWAIRPPPPEPTESPIPSSPTQEPTEAATATATPIPTATDTALPTHTDTPTAAHTPTDTPTPIHTPTPTPTPGRTEARVTYVIDGDTIEVEIAGVRYQLRYIGIDCPEPEEPGGGLAAEVNGQLVAGQTVQLEKDVSETDPVGRLLRYVYVGHVFVNAELVRLGYASAKSYPPDVAYDDVFKQMEREAREAGRGLWAVPTPTSGTAWNCIGNIYNCSDFSSCGEVMSYWNACPGDPSRLDGDHDGRPCESLCR
jgi:endonuclease YncB( thermonuclease family)